MTLEEALYTALDYERNVVQVYADSIDRTADSKGKRVLAVLSNEEKDHVAYLEKVLDGLTESGKLTAEDLQTAIPSEQAIREGIAKLRAQMSDKDRPVSAEAELEILQKALDVETETSGFYQRVVGELDDEWKQFFKRFVQIEEGHKAIVQAEIDSVSGTGYWFDFREFSLEAA